MATLDVSADASQPANPQSAPSPSTSALPVISIGTRRSLLALKQTDIVEAALKKAWPDRDYAIHAMATMGDKNQVTPLHEMGAKALWTHELEALLLEGRLDLVVHSLKDMPTQLPASLSIGAIFPREDPRDALVMRPSLLPSSTSPPRNSHDLLSTLPPGSVIGTSSVRRSAQLVRLYPHLTFASVRGNVGTRLSKLDAPDSPYSALILAAAGLLRLGLGDRITALLSSREGGILHAVGQGALGIEVREADGDISRILGKVGCERTTRMCLAERSLMRTLEGGCSVPIGVETEWVDAVRGAGDGEEALTDVAAKPAPEDQNQSNRTVEGKENGTEVTSGQKDDSAAGILTFRAIVVSLDGKEAAEGEMTRRIASREDADQFGWDMARLLVERGADKILEKINLNRNIIHEQGDA
ncbi:porphobilinogen deaminase [Coniosporium apollinis]|uniref:hydroxymethylbilane synthase n=1 Tax=Coniosporium apollinis TaxID=61459 RepID=A0ABQ9NGG9_9PEZI|nr:porphobilinogen deaminase [Coniosporium apollinis]